MAWKLTVRLHGVNHHRELARDEFQMLLDIARWEIDRRRLEEPEAIVLCQNHREIELRPPG